MKMECPNCGAAIREGVRFCESCGAGLGRRCPACGAEPAPEARFCGTCGHDLSTAVSPKVDRITRARATERPDSYTPAHIAERILRSRNAVEGERKQVTVLFADIVGSLGIIQGGDPEQAHEILDAAVKVMMDAVHQYEGTVNKVLGDGVMALFGAPLALEDHAVRACYAALRIQREMQSFAAETRRRHGIAVQTRCGLHSGEVVVRAIGNDLTMDYDAIGPTVHLASRMEQMATPGTTCLSAETLHLAEGFVQVRSLGPAPVKGLAEPVEVYELTGTGAARTRLQAAAARGLTQFIGREAEMKAIHQGQEEASDGHGQIVSVVGEPGVGKSRLFYEFLHSHRVENWLVLENDSVSYGKARPWLPVTDLLKGYFGVDDDDEARLVSERVAGKLVMLGEALKPAMSPLLALLGVPVDDGDWNTLDAEQRHRRTVDAVKAVLLRESQVQPLILVFEDLHWVDENSQALLDSLVESLPTNRLLLLVNYRPEYEHAWGGRTYYTQLRIDPLGQNGAEAMLASLLGSDPRLDGLNRMLVERTEGNPLFAEESVRALVESGALTGERGAYRLTRNVDRLDIPVTVQNILAARIDRLSPEAKHVLQCAAVVGHYVQYLVLQSVAELAEGDLRAHLAELQGAEYLYEARLFPELEYTFKHALTHEVAYGSILQDRRRELHLRSGEAIERLYPNRPNRWYIVTHHYFQAEAWQKVAKLSIAWSEFG